MTQPEALKKNEPLLWSPGTGTDVWQMFCSAINGDLKTIKQLLKKDPSLVRCSYEYRTPLYFAVRENQLDVAAFLLDEGANPIWAIWGSDDCTLHNIAHDRGFTDMEKLLEQTLAAKYGISPGGEAIPAAIREHNIKPLKDKLDASPELLHSGDALGNRPIHWAVMTRQIDVIDEDQGHSGTTAEGRTGFQRLLGEVSLNHVGIILGTEMSRIARSNKDWHRSPP